MSDPQHRLPGEIQRLGPSPPRRVFALAVLYGLGGLVAALSLDAGLGPGARLALLVLGGLGLWQGERLRRGTRGAVVLTGEGLCDDAGRSIAPLGDIASVDRGVFAFKPSNGFLVRLARPAGRAWVPGMWWRLGRRVGIGGLTRGAEAREMADRLSLMLDRR